MQSEDLYQLLQCTPSSTPAELRASYRKLVRRYHPDLTPNDPDLHARFHAVTAAYDVLSDPKKRSMYDQLGVAAVEAGFDPARIEHIGPGAEVRTRLVLPFVEAVNGTERRILVHRRRGSSGPVTVRIPPGVTKGQLLRVPHAGEPGRPPGDLLVDVHVAPHPIFTRKGSDVLLTLPVTLKEYICGGQITIPTPSGRILLDLPACAPLDAKIRVAGHGVASTRGSPPGDLLVSIRLEVPSEFSTRRDAMTALDALERLYPRPVRDGLFQVTGSTGNASVEVEAEEPVDEPTLS
ncbi:MAG: DnaJ C-terminal domain-containing protein [Myxococcota bacterium]